MASPLTAHGKIKTPKWMHNVPSKHKPFPKRKPGNITFAEQITIVILFAIFLMIIFS